MFSSEKRSYLPCIVYHSEQRAVTADHLIVGTALEPVVQFVHKVSV